ncbi:MAG: primosomal protein N' [Chloroflexi bacterium]|nr:primosomal protein N' [Chloroflexota bacterium]MCL5108308.1 primosomal protein N' [Chloroflexota bacterium]
MRFAEVAVTCRTGKGSGTFTYSIPDDLDPQAGDLVWVPFGRRQVQGVVFQVGDVPPPFATKTVVSVTERAVFLPAQIALARWLADNYCCPLSTVVSQMLPAEIRQAATPVYSLSGKAAAEPVAPLTLALLHALAAGSQGAAELRKVTPGPAGRAALRRLVEQGVVGETWVAAPAKGHEKRERTVRLALPPGAVPAALSSLHRSPAQAAALRWLAGVSADGSEVSLTGACAGSGTAPTAFSGLHSHGYVEVGWRAVRRSPLAGTEYPPMPLPTLTTDQAAVFARLAEALRSGKAEAFLLHGVTGSGKGEVYLHALAETIRLGRTALVLVPEIALTPQTIRRFVARFAGRVAVLHSRLSTGEHYDEWQRARHGKVDVIIGSRSALFAPLPNLGLIVVDEEHEWAYKQTEKDPRYHARDAALALARQLGAVAVLGSATPDVCTYYRAVATGDLRLLELRQRVQASGARAAAVPSPVPGSVPLPKVQVVDMRTRRRTLRGLFSLPLARGIVAALRTGSQVILYVNRRGTSTLVACRTCGWVARCRRCDLPLVYHADRGQLLCHQCNRVYPVPVICPECWNRNLDYQGTGTQRVETETRHLFPKARVVRWDSDSTRGKGAHQRILERFLRHEADILVGTQMVAKGLDLPEVALVGVVAADTTLHLPDFRAAERTFQLLTQVSGRAGRGLRAGKVVVQTLSPEHYCLRAATAHDYASFYTEELRFRLAHRYPPFARLAKLVYATSNEAHCRREAERVAAFLRAEIERKGLPDLEVLGPAPSFRRRLRGRFRWQILVRGDDPRIVLAGLPLRLGWALDIDPVSIL